MKQIFALKGHIIDCDAQKKVRFCPDSHLLIENGLCLGVFPQLPAAYANVPVRDHGDKLILPGFVDLHLHASQYANRGLGLDLELLQWLEQYTFPQESKFACLDYACSIYRAFCRELRQGPVTRACIFATLHTPATLRLMDMLEESGLVAYVGKVNMDRNAPDDLREAGPEQAAADTRRWLAETAARGYRRVKPILTPRFAPSCSPDLLRLLGEMAREGHLPVQSHLSENRDEVALVKRLFPDSPHYAGVYAQYGLLEAGIPAIMAHGLYLQPAEVELLGQCGAFIAHCPSSNANLASGIAPVKALMEAGVPVGLGSDIGAGHSMNLLRLTAQAVACSKLLQRQTAAGNATLRLEEAFYLATRGGGAFFGKAGAFSPGFAADAVVLDDARIRLPQDSLEQRWQKLFYLGDEREICAKYVNGVPIDLQGQNQR
ncbi:MAG: amidohydrolase family protein [Firmicutes bacterium]|nr:amidohydrolase family protein [Bacillota bacterium]